MSDLLTILDQLGIVSTRYDHPAVFTVADAEKYERGQAAKSKNLFLRDKKGARHFLVVLAAEKRVDLAKLGVTLNVKNLSFASPSRLLQYLQLTPGSVSPFGLIHDRDKRVEVVVDQSLLKETEQGFHPNTNTATLIISTDDFLKFLSWTGNKITTVEI